MEILEDLIKLQEEHVRGACMDIEHAMDTWTAYSRYPRSAKVIRLFSIDKTLSCSLLRSPVMPSSAFTGRISLPATWSDDTPLTGTLSAT